MNARFFPAVERWTLPETALRDSIAEMARDGAVGNEGVVLWLGRRTTGEARVTHLVALRDRRVIKRPDQLLIPASVFADVSDVAAELGISLIGQIHSHGPGYGTNLSLTDRTHGIAVPYYLSLVAPDYAMRPAIPLSECGVHVFEPNQGFRRLTPMEVHTRIALTPDLQAPIVIVGADSHG